VAQGVLPASSKEKEKKRNSVTGAMRKAFLVLVGGGVKVGKAT
jgi:hypothetical protein